MDFNRSTSYLAMPMRIEYLVNLILARTDYADFALPGSSLILLSTQITDKFGIDMTIWPPLPSTVFACLPAMRSVYNWCYHKAFYDLNQKWLAEVQPRHNERGDAQGENEGDVNEDEGQELVEDGELVLQIDVNLNGEEEGEDGGDEQAGVAGNGGNAQGQPENQHVRRILGRHDLVDGSGSIGQTVLGALVFPAVAAGMGNLISYVLPSSWLTYRNIASGRPGLLSTKWGRSVMEAGPRASTKTHYELRQVDENVFIVRSHWVELEMHTSSIRAALAHAFQITVRPSLPRVILTSLSSSTETATQGATSSRLSFSTSAAQYAKKKGSGRPDRRITLIRYFLHHPTTLTPRPLRFSRNRYLRHWTIARAWNLYRHNLKKSRELELERQYNAMRDANEELRVGAGDGGRLFRKAQTKTGIWGIGGPGTGAGIPGASSGSGGRARGGVPIEYARGLVEWVGSTGGLGVGVEEGAGEGSGSKAKIWDYAWKRH
ncbi:hypothetical protein CLAIMM_01726 [Cladophialophora immunda]|nr:hypothetical protein CLAIMM_01726 [Cladophialophora immunda]